MALCLYNTLTLRKEEFVPINPQEIQLYTCGPSVYDTPHLGNYRTFIYEDLLKRVLLHKGYSVRHVMNITDLETKGITAAKKARTEFWGLMDKNTKVFFDGLKEFRVIPATIYPRASRNVNEMVYAIKELMKKGYAYRQNGDVYFDISKSKNYGVLSRYKFTKKQLNSRVRLYDYQGFLAGDFLLWYGYRKSHGKICWNTEIGKGMPAWNAECPALCMKFLKIPMDIHAGGFDNIFSHHENEIAQIQSLTGKFPAKYWFHVRHLMVEGKKMSKSLKNYYSVKQLKDMGFSITAIKWLLLSKPYTKKVNFTLKKLREFEGKFKEFQKTVRHIKRVKRCRVKEHFCDVVLEKRALFFEALDDGLDFETAFMHAMDLILEASKRRKNGLLCKGCMREFMRAIREFDRATGAFPT
ncbi:MAG: cysteine--tRNA ligase [Candidatus Micrarchaeota archaeon]